MYLYLKILTSSYQKVIDALKRRNYTNANLKKPLNTAYSSCAKLFESEEIFQAVVCGGLLKLRHACFTVQSVCVNRHSQFDEASTPTMST